MRKTHSREAFCATFMCKESTRQMQHKYPPSCHTALGFPGILPEALASPSQHSHFCTLQEEEDTNNPCVAKRGWGTRHKQV